MQISFSAAGKATNLGSDIALGAKTDRNGILEQKLAMHNLAINFLWADFPKPILPVCEFWSGMHCGQNVDE